MVDEEKLGKEVTAVVVAWVIEVEMNSGHFLSNSGSKEIVEIEDIG